MLGIQTIPYSLNSAILYALMLIPSGQVMRWRNAIV